MAQQVLEEYNSFPTAEPQTGCYKTVETT